MSARIVLASTSRYRRELLQRLRVPFDVQAPQVDEAPRPGEAPRDMALRLAAAKARDVMVRAPGAIVIGSDQVAEVDGEVLNKPMEHAVALAQLQRLQGREARFHTALAVVGPQPADLQIDCITTVVRFRTLATASLDAYLRADQPYDCAGAAKVESLGIALVERVQCDDPTALIGLPLIRLTTMLAQAGVDVLNAQP